MQHFSQSLTSDDLQGENHVPNLQGTTTGDSNW